MRPATIIWGRLVLILLLGFAACAAPTTSTWEKSGADDATKAEDMSDCRAAAHKEAARLYPYSSNPPYSGTPTALPSQQRDERGQAAAEDRAFTRCMRNKGYERTSSQEE